MMQFGETDSHSRLLGLIGAVKDDLCICFDYGDLMVGRERGSLYVWNPETGKRLGGRHLLEGASIKELAEWVEAKADYYGAN
jgi:hypothetical protein